MLKMEKQSLYERLIEEGFLVREIFKNPEYLGIKIPETIKDNREIVVLPGYLTPEAFHKNKDLTDTYVLFSCRKPKKGKSSDIN